MVQLLRALAALAEDSGLISSTHTVANNQSSVIQIQGTRHPPLLASAGTAFVQCTYIHACKTAHLH